MFIINKNYFTPTQENTAAARVLPYITENPSKVTKSLVPLNGDFGGMVGESSTRTIEVRTRYLWRDKYLYELQISIRVRLLWDGRYS